MCLLGSRRHQISASAGPKERTRWCVPKRWGESSIVPAGSSMLLKWLSSSHQTTFAGSMLPSSAAGEKCSQCQAPWTDIAYLLVTNNSSDTTSWDWVLLCSYLWVYEHSVLISATFRPLFRISICFQKWVTLLKLSYLPKVCLQSAMLIPEQDWLIWSFWCLWNPASA